MSLKRHFSATDIFAFQGSQTRSNRKASLPDVIKTWSNLQTDYLAASMASGQQAQSAERTAAIADEVDDTNKDSMLVVTDNLHRLHFFLDGTYPLGFVILDRDWDGASVTFVQKHPKKPLFCIHSRVSSGDSAATILKPTYIHLPLLETRHVRDLARLSTSARELLWYVMRVVKDMRAVWFGSESNTGAREMGPRWVRALEAKQKEQFGRKRCIPHLNASPHILSQKKNQIPY